MSLLVLLTWMWIYHSKSLLDHHSMIMIVSGYILARNSSISDPGQREVLLYTFPPSNGLCPNHEVVMFQPHKVTPPYLGSAVNCSVR